MSRSGQRKFVARGQLAEKRRARIRMPVAMQVAAAQIGGEEENVLGCGLGGREGIAGQDPEARGA